MKQQLGLCPKILFLEKKYLKKASFLAKNKKVKEMIVDSPLIKEISWKKEKSREIKRTSTIVLLMKLFRRNAEIPPKEKLNPKGKEIFKRKKEDTNVSWQSSV